MNRLYLILIFCALAIPAFLPAQCLPGQAALRLEIDSDEFLYEISWSILNKDETIQYAGGNPSTQWLESHTYCIPDTGCLVFRISDWAGTGMPGGSYKLYYNDSLVLAADGDFGAGRTTYLNCGVGQSCENRLPAAEGNNLVAGGKNWFSFTPAANGTYLISTCDSANTCATKFWVYDQCGYVYPNQLGAIFFAESGCTDTTAQGSVFLAGGKEYIIRIGVNQGYLCFEDSVIWSITYQGPVVGCMDSTACNFNPLATVDAACFYLGSPECPEGPDLWLREDVLRSTLSLSTYDNTDNCTVMEGCLTGMGQRYIVNFDTRIDNIGSQDYFIGAPPVDPNQPNSQFLFDPCHNHWHYAGYAEYLLFDQAGASLPVGFKNGFCVIDLVCDSGAGKYTCDNMGMSVGCADVYAAGIPCQWIDVTDVPDGDYTFVARVNWDQSPDAAGRTEFRFDNNWAQACLRITRDAQGVPSLEVLTDCPQFMDCAGEVFGSAQPDCKGVCNGPALRGDINEDAQRNAADISLYLDHALNPFSTAMECTDLFADDLLDVYDAALLLECDLHQNDPAHWFSRIPCRFPTGLQNVDDQVFLLPGEVNVAEKYFDVKIVNPYRKQMGYQFKVSGLVIQSVENLVPGYTGILKHNNEGEVLALSLSESLIPKNLLPTNLVRIHYSELTAAEVCIESVAAFVNENYNKANAAVAPENCAGSGWVSAAGEPGEPGFGVFAYPNPASERLTLYFPNPTGEAVNVVLRDANGREWKRFERLLNVETIVLETNELAAGVYFYEVTAAGGSAVGKVVIE